jgi:hypothetical protein
VRWCWACWAWDDALQTRAGSLGVEYADADTGVKGGAGIAQVTCQQATCVGRGTLKAQVASISGISSIRIMAVIRDAGESKACGWNTECI